MQRIAVIDYGMGNLRSVSKALEHVAPDDDVLVTSDRDAIRGADRIVCPGQGAAADCMKALRDIGMDALIQDILGSRPFLGICMGYQVLFDRSAENEGVNCLGYFNGHVQRFEQPLYDQDMTRLKVPHMGWSEVEHIQAHALWKAIPQNSRFYFAHSYYCEPVESGIVNGQCSYGRPFAASVAHGNLFACQFHPEKSAKAGLQLLENFVQWNG